MAKVREARTAGFLYLLMGIVAPVGLLYVPSRLIVSGNVAATADNLRGLESLVRLGIVSELVHQALAIFLVLALYRLFKEVDERLSKQLVVLGALVSVPIVFVNVLNEIAALALAGNAALSDALQQPERDALAYLFLHLHGQGIVVASIFWGLWLFPFGMLVIRSGFIPRALGVLLWIAGAGYLLSALTTLALPAHAPLVTRLVSPLAIAELPIIFWLLIRGARTRQVEIAAAKGATPARG